MTKLFIAIVVIFISGCAAQTGVISTGQDSYMILNQGTGFWVSPSTLVANATREAGNHCSNQRKQLDILSTQERPFGLRPGAYPEGEIRFACK
ncbi:hypothetical protein [Janthinobacterium sp. RA13]|uniref:hypothetical protein n=1 Tax=Janthinobacterium sp. RA13 TaxID=1502762 RepID=UPI0012698F52|nr:hypothetical protein [Janthinobacterium sp. RA13]